MTMWRRQTCHPCVCGEQMEHLVRREFVFVSSLRVRGTGCVNLCASEFSCQIQSALSMDCPTSRPCPLARRYSPDAATNTRTAPKLEHLGRSRCPPSRQHKPTVANRMRQRCW